MAAAAQEGLVAAMEGPERKREEGKEELGETGFTWFCTK